MLINDKEFHDKILSYIGSDEINKIIDNTAFKNNKKYRQAVIHGMCLASMLTSDCKDYDSETCHPKKREDSRYYDCSKCGGWMPQPQISSINPKYCMWCGARVIY